MKLRDLIPQHINESMTDMQLEDAIESLEGEKETENEE